MTEEDRIHWDGRYARAGPAPAGYVGPPPVFAPYGHLFPTEGRAMEIACGPGRAAVWLAGRGLDVWGLDVSAVAVGLARKLAAHHGVGDRCRFEVIDLDDGLPEGPPVDLILCHLFRDSRLDQAIIERLAPGGLLAIAVLSEIDVGPGPFRVVPGELHAAFAKLEVVAEGEQRGEAWVLARAGVARRESDSLSAPRSRRSRDTQLSASVGGAEASRASAERCILCAEPDGQSEG